MLKVLRNACSEGFFPQGPPVKAEIIKALELLHISSHGLDKSKNNALKRMKAMLPEWILEKKQIKNQFCNGIHSSSFYPAVRLVLPPDTIPPSFWTPKCQFAF